jgi:hypothetical protein
MTHICFNFSYALGVRNLENVHHRAGYPKIQESETKLNSIPLSLRLRGIKFDILAQDQHVKPSLAQLMYRISEKLVLAHLKGS